MENDFYLRLEERFRGSIDLVKQRLGVYLPLTAQVQALYPAGLAIDVGCGRGEWLTLMKEQGFTGLGIDTNADMVAVCAKQGINAECADALDRLSAIEDASVALVSGFHIAEHLPFDTLMALMQQAHRVLLPGGLLILETPNPENLDVGLWAFYMDPTHRHPIPAPLLQFLGEEAGFADNHILKLNGPEKPGDDQPPMARVTWALSAHPDSSLVAQKAGVAQQQLRLDNLICSDLSPPLQQLSRELEQLQHGWDVLPHEADMQQQAAEQNAALRQELDATLDALQAAEHDAETAREHYLNVRHQLHEVQSQFSDLESRAAEVYRQLMVIHQSVSWRILAKLGRLRSVPVKLGNIVRRIFRGLYRVASRIPVVRRLLKKLPFLQRLKHRMYPAAASHQARPQAGSQRQRIAADIESRLNTQAGQDHQGGN